MANQKMITTFSCRRSSDPIMTGKEDFKIFGNAVQPEIVKSIISQFVGLNLYYDCNRKAEIASRFLISHGIGFDVIFGALLIDSKEKGTQYGFKFNPPLEFHCWIGLPEENILDISLPGTILKGRMTLDCIGPLLVGREEFILNGRPKKWLHYKPHNVTRFKPQNLTMDSLGR